MIFQRFLPDIWSTISIILLNILVILYFCLSTLLAGAYWALVIILSLSIIVLTPIYLSEWLRSRNHPRAPIPSTKDTDMRVCCAPIKSLELYLNEKEREEEASRHWDLCDGA